VVGGGRVLAVAARSHVHGDPLALDEDLHGAAGEPHLDLAAREAIGNAVEVALDIDVVVDTDTAHAPFGEDIGLGRQGLRGHGRLELQLRRGDLDANAWRLDRRPHARPCSHRRRATSPRSRQRQGMPDSRKASKSPLTRMQGSRH